MDPFLNPSFTRLLFCCSLAPTKCPSRTMVSSSTSGISDVSAAAAAAKKQKNKATISSSMRPQVPYKPFHELVKDGEDSIKAMICCAWDAKNPYGKYLGTEYIMSDENPRLWVYDDADLLHYANTAQVEYSYASVNIVVEVAIDMAEYAKTTSTIEPSSIAKEDVQWSL